MKNISDHHTYVIKDAEDRGFTLDNDYCKLEENNPVKSYSHFWQGTNQLWNFKKSKYGGYTIHTATDNEWALTKQAEHPHRLVLNTFNPSSTDQVWSITPDSQLMSFNSGHQLRREKCPTSADHDDYYVDAVAYGTPLTFEAYHATPEPNTNHFQAPIVFGKMTIKDDAWETTGAITGYTQQGLHDWAYKHNRMLCPGNSKTHVNFTKSKISGSYYSFKVVAFGPANIADPCILSMGLNSVDKAIHVEIKSECRGRTTAEFTFPEEDLMDENTMTLTFQEGMGVLFLDQFTIEACGEVKTRKYSGVKITKCENGLIV
jgi:hypothetical protein